MPGNGANGNTRMLITEGFYLKPSKSTRVLAILDALSRDSSLSQFELRITSYNVCYTKLLRSGPGVPPVPSLTVTVAAQRAVWSAAVTVNEAV